MLFEEKTLNNIMIDLKNTVEGDTNTEEGTLVDHSFRGAAAEFEQAYIVLGLIDQNGYAVTADREHLLLRAKERGMEPLPASNAVWKARFNQNVKTGTRFSAGALTYICTEQMEEKVCRVMCEQAGSKGNQSQGTLMPIKYIEGLEDGELLELLKPARDVEKTEDFRKRYLANVAAPQACSGNREQYKQTLLEIEGVGACKIYRVTETEQRIRIYFLNNLYQIPSGELVEDVQEIIDPKEKQGEGEGKAPIFHTVDICPCIQETIDIETDITIDTGYTWENLLPEIEGKIDGYYLELAKGWEKEEHITVRILRINAAIASVEGIVDVQKTFLNGKAENVLLDPNAIPARGGIRCRQQS